MTHNPATGAREFVVPFGGIPEGGHFHAPAELLLEVGPRRRVAVRYFPSNQEFQLRLFDLVKGTTFADQAAQISMDCSQGAQPVVTFEADSRITVLLPAKLDSLPALDAYLATNPPLLDLGAFTLGSIETRQTPPA